MAVVAPLPEPVLPLVLARRRSGRRMRWRATLPIMCAAARWRRCGGKDTGRAGALPIGDLAVDVGWWREQGGEALARFERWFGAGDEKGEG
ncbi:MAG: hypothetical protein U0841_16235 [Chloroflexia bacterium]